MQHRYPACCNPRPNAQQSLKLAFLTAKALKQERQVLQAAS